MAAKKKTQPKKRKGLTAKQKAFVDEYLVDMNATQAAIRAGYSERTAGQIGDENLKKPQIADEIRKAMAERAERTGITADRVLREYARIGFADIRDVMDWSAGGVTLKDAEDIPDDVAATISEIAETKDGLKVKQHSKIAALDSIGKHLGMFRERVELSGPAGGPIQIEDLTNMSDEDLEGLANGGD